jgi:hypothetical protein
MLFGILHSAVRSHLHPPPLTLNRRFPSSAERVSRGESVGQRCGNDTLQRVDMPCVRAQLSHCLVSRRQLTILQCCLLFLHKLQMIHCTTVSCSPQTTVSILHHYFIYISVFSSHPSSSLHVSAVYGHCRESPILLKLLHWMSKLRIACERYISWLK